MIYTAPVTIPDWGWEHSVFLAGTIDMGNSVDWQDETARTLDKFGFNVFNPRRHDWDSSWEQKIENEQFNKQVTWELDCLGRANYRIFNFVPGSQSPITLLELGLYIDKPGTFVVCPEGFWRKGNVDIVSNRFGRKVYGSLDAALTELIRKYAHLTI